MNLLIKLTDLIERITKRQFITFILGVLFVFVIFVLNNWFFRNYSTCATFLFGDSTKSNGELAKFVITIAGGLLVFYGLLLNARRTKAMEIQNEISMSGQVGERFKNAIEHLGSENSAIILGGIYALHRIAKENDSYRPVVFEILCSYIREKTHSIKIMEDIDPDDMQLIKPSIVIQTIVDILFKSQESSEYTYSELFADLKGVKCMNVDFSFARFDNVDFSNARLEYADFQFSTLDYAKFKGSNLYNAKFFSCLLREVDFKNCKMVHANLIKTTCNGADFENSYLVNALFIESDLSNATLKSSILRNTHFELSNLSNADLTDTQINNTHFEASVLYGTVFHESDIKNAHFEGATQYEFRTGNVEEDLDNRIEKVADLSGIENNETEVFSNRGILTEKIGTRILDLYNNSVEFD